MHTTPVTPHHTHVREIVLQSYSRKRQEEAKMSEAKRPVSKLSEADVERYLVRKVKEELKGKAYKWVSPGNTGVPDRIVFLPGGRIFLVELKALGRKQTPAQFARQAELIVLGATVYGCVDTKAKVDAFMAEVSNGF
jgi:hypothetical protein